MSEEKKNTLEKKKETKSQKEKNELDKEFRQTFPASDPPSRSRPGRDRTVEDVLNRKGINRNAALPYSERILKVFY